MSDSGHASGYEKSDVNIKMVALWGSATILFIVISLIVLNDYFLSVREDLVYEQILKPESVKLIDLRAAEDSVLTSYQLIDTAKGIYRIPIDRALELVAEEAVGSSK